MNSMILNISKHVLQPVVTDLVIHEVQMLQLRRENCRYFLYGIICNISTVELKGVQVLKSLQCFNEILLIARNKTHAKYLNRPVFRYYLKLTLGEIMLAEDKLCWVGH